MVTSENNMADGGRFGIIPKDIEGVLLAMEQMYEKLQALEKSHADVKLVVNKIEAKIIYLITGVVLAVGAKYGIDLSGISR